MFPSFPSIARLRIPENTQPALDARLRNAGLSPESWFCVLHYREVGYEARPDVEARDFDPAQAVEVTRYITESLGGQVVRIGHPGMSPFPDIPGFIDLSGVEDGFPLQANAVARSRFFLELSPSGPMALAPAMGVPVGRCNALITAGPVDDQALVLLKHIRRPNGALMSGQQLISEKIASGSAMPQMLIDQDYRFVSNSVEELMAAADEMMDMSRDCMAWRNPKPVMAFEPPNRFEWPLRHTMRHRIADYPHLRDTIVPS